MIDFRLRKRYRLSLLVDRQRICCKCFLSLRFKSTFNIILSNSDFDDDTTLMEGQPSGLAATQVFSETPAAAKLLAGTSSNPLDDLVSIFGGNGGGVPMSATTNLGFGAFGGPGAGVGVGFGGAPLSPIPPTPNPALPPKPSSQQPQSRHQQDDLLGLF